MSDIETLRALVKETMTLLRELIMDQGKQLTEIKEVIPEIRSLREDTERLYAWRRVVDTKLVEFSTQQAVNKVSKEALVRDEERGYQDRKHLWKTVFDIGLRLAGTLAVVGLLIDRIF